MTTATNLHPIFQAALAPFVPSQSVLAAEFTEAGRGIPAKLTINHIANGRRRFVSEHTIIGGKRAARMLARNLGAKPWNF